MGRAVSSGDKTSRHAKIRVFDLYRVHGMTFVLKKFCLFI